MYRPLIRENVTLVSIVLFLILFGLIQISNPKFLYNTDGSIREFGVGYKNKTILPIWLLSIVLGIFSYLFVIYYLAHPKIFG
jgi:sterol desaturase/sphingolipid hydroxylase (fatty acid hydroxylase superfamily)